MQPYKGIPAAQYLRMSTDHQQYSLDNQADAIARYAEVHGFRIVKTYSDAAKSGVRLKNRAGLKQLLKDVMEGQQEFRAVLAYDVSRWGRFQDMDEAAHYEYLCKSAGVPIHYCAEMFSNDNSISGLVLKALKRTMAGEYSRELSVKVKTGLLRLAKLGYKLGGTAPYGLRRQLLNLQGKPKQLLEYGERKSLANDRVKLVPGPAEEVAIVQRIFHEFAEESRSVNSIADRLNRDGVPCFRDSLWTANTLRSLLQDPRYVGMQVWGRTSSFLSGPLQRHPVSDWAIYPNACEPIITQELYLRAQEVFANFTNRLSDEELLDRLAKVNKKHGKLTGRIIDKSRLCPGLTTYNKRFGGLLNAYARIGYPTQDLHTYASMRQRALFQRDTLIKSIVETFPNEIEEVRANKRFRPMLRYRRTGSLITVVVARRCTRALVPGWIIKLPRSQRQHTTLLALLSASSDAIEALNVFGMLPDTNRRLVRKEDDWFEAGIRLERISDFLDAVRAIQLRKEGSEHNLSASR